jgi:four helix bundle protein
MASYRDLKVWQLGVDLALEIYRLTADFPKQEIYGLTAQLRRAAVSIPSNIAEGHARKTQRELQRFLHVAKGSLAELETQLIIARELGFASNEKLDKVLGLADQESKMLSSLLRSVGQTL